MNLKLPTGPLTLSDVNSSLRDLIVEVGIISSQGGGGATSLAGLSDVREDATNLLMGNGAGGTSVNGYSTSVGINSLNILTSGVANTGIGWGTLALNQTGGFNVAVGTDSLPSADVGGYNTGIGAGAGFSVTTGTQNVAVGANSDNSASAINQISIGYQAITDTDNTAKIGNGDITDVYFGDGTAILHGAIAGTHSSTITTPTTIDSTQYITLRINGTNYHIALATPGT